MTSPATQAENSSAPEREQTRGGISLRAIAQMAVFAALIGAMGLVGAISVPGLVPITLQTLGVMLAGAVLGPWRGAGSVLLLFVLIAIGFPLAAAGRGGLAVFAGPSAGYFVGWVFGAIVVGLIVQGLRGNRVPTWWSVALGCVAGGLVTVYLFGVPVQAVLTGMTVKQAIISSLAFIPGDLIKTVVAVLVTMGLWKAYPRAFRA